MKIFFLTATVLAVFFGPAIGLASQACTPNNPAGCSVCNSSGTAWIDVNSKCGAGQVCQSWTCINAANKIKNKIESASCDIITGWICDPNNSSAQYRVEFYLDETNSSSVDSFMGYALANSRRTDLTAQCGSAPAYGFNFSVPAKTANSSRAVKDGLAHSIHVIGLRNDTKTDAWIIFDDSPKNIQCSTQTGQNGITVTSTPNGVTEKSIGANEGDSAFNINDLIDAGIKNYRIYTAPPRFIWDSEGWAWGSVSIAQIKANPNLIPWDKWDAAIRDANGYTGGLAGKAIGQPCSTDNECSAHHCSASGVCSWRRHGISFYNILTQLKANGIAPVIQMDNYWVTAVWGDTSQGWGAYPAGIGITPPKTQGDLNELWERTFATVYELNVRNNLDVNDWEISNEPDGTFPGTVADYVKFSQVCYDAIKYVYDTYLPGKTFHYYEAVTAGVDLAGATNYLTNSIQQNGRIITDIDWHNYSSTFPADVQKIHGWLNQYNAGSKGVYLSEWGDWEGKSGNYNVFANAMTNAKYLMQHSLIGGSYIDKSSIFSLYDWGKAGGGGYMPGLISGSGTKTVSYYAFRMVTRGFQGAKTIYNLSGAPSDQNVLVAATKDSSNIYLTVLNNGANTYNLDFDINSLAPSGSYALRLFSSAKNDEIVSTGIVNAGKLSLTSNAGSITQAVITIDSYTTVHCQAPCSIKMTTAHYASFVCYDYKMVCSGMIACDGKQCTCDDADCPKTCAPKTCQALNYNCGTAADGCGGTLNCGTCGTNQTCSANACITTACVPKTCATMGYNCGKTGDGCGNTLDCGTCSSAQSCTSGQCVAGQTCVPKTCASLGYSCGNTGDGCGSTLNCGNCAINQQCVNNACQASTLTQNTDNTDATLASLYAQIEYLQNEIIRVTNLIKARISSASLSCSSINYNLSYGMKNDPQVKCLQQFLKSQGFLTSSPTGNYYTLTKKAVTAFQSRYADELLVPYGLNHGSGNIDAATRAKINQLMGGK